MENYKLVISIDPESLHIFYTAGLKVTIAKKVGTLEPNIVWLSFDAFQSNTVTWSNDYGLYASFTSDTQEGSKIAKVSEVYPAARNHYYTFTSDRIFNGPLADNPPGHGVFKIQNLMPYSSHPTVYFGLQQTATVNGMQLNHLPINYSLVPSQYSVTYKPTETIYVWMQSRNTAGTVLQGTIGSATIVTFDNLSTEHCLEYDKPSGKFLLTT